MKITTDLVGNESAAVRQTRLKAVTDWYFGAGAYVAAANLGAVRALLNSLPGPDIANGEEFGMWLTKFNLLNDVSGLVGAMFGGSGKGLLLDASRLDLLDQVSTGGTPVTTFGQPVGLVRRLAGTLDAAQAVSASRPTTGRHPGAGLRNLLTWTEDLGNAAWTKSNTTVNGLQVRDTNSSTGHNIRRMMPLPAGTYTFAFSASAVGAVLGGTVLFSTSASEIASIHVNLLTGVVAAGRQDAGTSISSTIAPDGGGYYRVIVTITTTNPIDYYDVRMAVTWPVPSGTGQSYVGDGVSGIDFRDIQMQSGATSTPYQRVTSAYDVTQAGQPDVWYLGGDGVDDFLSTASVTWDTDEVTLIAGVAKASETGNQMVAEFSNNIDANSGAFFMMNVAGQPGYRGRSKGTAYAEASVSSGWPAGAASVVTLEGKIATDTARLRINGVQRATSATDQGTGVFGSYPLYIGNRGAGGMNLNGRIYGLMAINRLLSAEEMRVAERWMAAKCGVTL